MRGALDGFLSSSRCRNPNTRRAYAVALDEVGLIDQVLTAMCLALRSQD